MTSPTPSPARLEELREQIARSLDPGPFNMISVNMAPTRRIARRQAALTKADAILALIRAQAEKIAELDGGGEAAAGDGRGAKR